MTNRQFSMSAFDSPLQTVASLGLLDDSTPLPGSSSHTTSMSDYTSTDAVVADAQHRLEAARRSDEARDSLVQELIARYQYVAEENLRLIQQLQEQKPVGYMRSSNNGPSYKDEYETLKRQTEHDPFILVLIDGDGMVFHEHFLNRGEAGGRQAADLLLSSARTYANELAGDVASGVKVVARMYANVQGLADVCTRAGLVDSPSQIEDFVRGFTRGQALFDFVDVGPGKDRADEKVSELFKLHAYDPRCKQIVFGCSHDNGFARLLEKYIYDKTITDRVTLLEGVPFEKELLALPYQRLKFGTIFRAEKIKITQAQVINATQAATAAALRAINRTPPESVSSVGEAAYSKPSTIVSWANRAAAAAAMPPPTPPAEKVIPVIAMAPPKEVVQRNRLGQRIDPKITYDKAEVDRIRKMKLCNVHYLRGECPYGRKCSHAHDIEPTKKTMEILKVVARVVCCRHGSGCDDPRCIYGHRCQAPKRNDDTKWANDGGKTCILGLDCQFPAELHNIDLVPVKTMKV